MIFLKSIHLLIESVFTCRTWVQFLLRENWINLDVNNLIKAKQFGKSCNYN